MINIKSRLENKSKKHIAITVISLIAIILVIILCFLKGCNKTDQTRETPTEPKTGIVYDKNAVEGGWNEADENKIRESLNKAVEEGYINISMNTTPIFKTGESEGHLMIVNETINTHPQQIIISRNDTDEIIYKSGIIPVGSKIERAKLDVNLSKGFYECTAMFYNIDENTGNSLGCAGATIYITVEN